MIFIPFRMADRNYLEKQTSVLARFRVIKSASVAVSDFGGENNGRILAGELPSKN